MLKALNVYSNEWKICFDAEGIILLAFSSSMPSASACSIFLL